jgi:hypothetical protein
MQEPEIFVYQYCLPSASRRPCCRLYDYNISAYSFATWNDRHPTTHDTGIFTDFKNYDDHCHAFENNCSIGNRNTCTELYAIGKNADRVYCSFTQGCFR